MGTRTVSLLFIGLILSFTISINPSFAVSDMERELRGAQVQIENGNVEQGLARIRYLCDKLFYTDACTYLKKPLKIQETGIVHSSPSISSSSSYINQISELDEALKLYEEKKYVKSLPIFEKLCEQNDEVACLYLGRSYGRGQGTLPKIDKAKTIFEKYRNRHPAFKLEEAFLLEYPLGSNPRNIDRAMEIYKELKDSKIDWIAQEATSGLQRNPIYTLIYSYLPAQGLFLRKSIDYNTFERRMYDVPTNGVPPELRDTFYDMRTSCLKSAKAGDNMWWDYGKVLAKSAGNSFFKTFTEGPMGLIEGVIEGFSYGSDWGKNIEDANNECKGRINIFFERLETSGISGKFVDQIINDYFPKSK